jgi:uncharacterized protein (DUF1330 family)
MAKKAYWISAHRKVNDAAKVAAYATLAKPALQSHGGRYLSLDVAACTYEAGVKGRVVIIEFDRRRHRDGRLSVTGISECASRSGRWRRARSPNCRGTRLT